MTITITAIAIAITATITSLLHSTCLFSVTVLIESFEVKVNHIFIKFLKSVLTLLNE